MNTSSIDMNQTSEITNQTPLSNLEFVFNEINTNVSDYTLDDILKMLEVDVTSISDYETGKLIISNKIDKYIDFFNKSKNYDLENFFEKIKKTLFGLNVDSISNITEGEKLLKLYTERDRIKPDGGLVETSNIIQRTTITKLLTIDSRFRNNYNSTLSTDFMINLPYVINNVTEIRLSDLEFPATFYPFQEEFENNYFWMKYTYNYGDGTDYSDTKYIYFYVAPGNYYMSNLIDELQTVLTNEGIGITITHNLDFDNDGGIGNGTGTLSIAFDSATDNISVTDIELNFKASKIPSSEYSYNASHVIDSDNEKIQKYYNVDSTIDYKQRMGWMLGFRENLYQGATSYVSEGQLDIIGPRYVYVVLNDYNSSSNVNFFSNKETALLTGDVFARISLKTYAFSVQSQNDFTIYGEPRSFFGTVNIDKLHIKVIDEYSRTLNLNGMDFSLTLQITVKHDSSTLT